MKRFLHVATALAVVLGLVTVAAPASAAETTARIRVAVTVDAGGDTMLTPGKDVSVTLWRQDPATSEYREQTATWSRAAAGGWVTSPLPTGTYRLRFVASDEDTGTQYWNDARYWWLAEDVTLAAGKTAELGTVSLHPWTVDLTRIAGADRYDTAVQISKTASDWVGTTRTVYLVTGQGFADALGAGPAAIRRGGVTLMTRPGGLPAVTRAELVRIRPSRIVLVGGTGVISAGVERAVRSAVPGAKVDRRAGINRYKTADAVIRDAFGRGSAPTVFLATGEDFPDALAAGAAAGLYGAPVVLVKGTAGRLPAETRSLFEYLGVGHVVIVGGTGAVSGGIESDIVGVLGRDGVQRFSGKNRYDTASAVNAWAFGPTDDTFIASGADYPDALAGTPLAGRLGAPVYLTRPACFETVAMNAMAVQRSNALTLFGGQGALSDAVAKLRTCG